LRDLAIADENIGILLRETGDLSKSLEALNAALATWRRLGAKYPADSQIQDDMAMAFTEAGDTLRAADQRTEAEASYQKSIAILEPLIAKNKSVPAYRERLIQALKGLGATQSAAHKLHLAVATWRQATAIGKELSPGFYEPLYWLTGCHALLGGVAGKPGSNISAEEGRAELDLAMVTLRRAIAAGYRSVHWMRRDPDLASLRGREDFELLMNDLEFPAEPFATAD
jgi:tetratricopeptide (TPR) repeat protein